MLRTKEDRLLEALGETPSTQLSFDSFEAPQEAGTEVPEAESYNQVDVETVAEQDINMLGGLAMPLVFKYLFPPVLVGVWALLCREVKLVRKFVQVAIGIPRGHAKTTVIKLFILYCILFTTKKFILIVGRTGPMAENMIADVIVMLDEPNIVHTFGSWRVDVITDRNELKKFTFRGRSIVLAAVGAKGSVRGFLINNERPDVIIFDDIQDADDANSEVISTAIETWMIGTAMKTKSPFGCLTVYIGNMFPSKFSILRKLKENKTWIKFISGAILEDGKALWEELRPLESLIQEFENDTEAGRPEIFLSEVMNDTDSIVTCNVDITKIKPWPYKEFELPQGKVIIIDPASGQRGSDPCSIGYFEVFDGIPGMRSLEEGNFSPGETILRTLLMCLRTGTKLVVCESNAYQRTFLYWFERTCEELGITGINFAPIYSTQVSKGARITEMLRSLTANEIPIHPEVRGRVLKQVTEWKPLSKHNNDGILDLLCYAPRAVHEFGGLMITNEEIVIQDAGGEGTIERAWAF